MATYALAYVLTYVPTYFWPALNMAVPMHKGGSNNVRFCCLLLLYAVLLLQDVFACTVHVAHVYMCVGRGTDPQIGLGQ